MRDCDKIPSTTGKQKGGASTNVASDQYRANYDNIFRKPKIEERSKKNG